MPLRENAFWRGEATQARRCWRKGQEAWFAQQSEDQFAPIYKHILTLRLTWGCSLWLELDLKHGPFWLW
jgi:hypothetical protein